MKALLLRDYYMMRGSLRSVAVLILLWSLIPQGFLNAFAVLYGAMLPFSLLALDQRSRWDRYARLLPYRDRDIVLNYYLLGWAVMALGAVLVTVTQGLLIRRSGQYFSLFAVLTALGAGWVLLAVNVPLMLRFGTEKGRTVSMLTTALTCGVAGILGSVSPSVGKTGETIALADAMRTAAPVALAAGVLATAISLPLSLKAYRRGTP